MQTRAVALGIFLLLVTTCVAVSRSAFAAPSSLDRVKKAGVLRWGADLQGGEPYVYQGENGKLTGFEVDIADAIGKQLGVRAELVQNDWSNLVPSLERGSFDIALNGLEITEARRARILFSAPYYRFAERLMARKGDGALTSSLATWHGQRIGTLANSLAFEVVRESGADPVLYEGTEEAYIDLSQSRTRGVLMDDIIANRYGAAHSDLTVVGDIREGDYAIGIPLDETELKAAIDDALAKMRSDGELEAILRRANLWNERQTQLTETKSEMAPPPTTPTATFDGARIALFFRGAAMTLLVSALAMVLAIAGGITLALARMFAPRAIGVIAQAYVEVYRGTPVLLQLYVLYYGLAPIIRLGAIEAAVIGLGMNYAAYEAEVYRAGIQAVPPGQMEAALSLGMSTPLALRRILLPQAFRLALPNVTNDFIALLKDSSLVSVITVVELTKQMTITAVDLRSWVWPGLACAGLYFAMSFPLSRISKHLEEKMARG
ncbi:MAG: ABC transporter substrate-binding protein/permease [Polyangiaceae bacterium]